MEEKNTNKYELSFLLAKEGDVEVINKHLSKVGAQDVVLGSVANLALSYPIEKHDKAYFGFVRFTMPRGMAGELNDALRLDNAILRSLLIASPIETKETTVSHLRRERADKPTVNRESSNEDLEEKLAALQGEAQ